MRHPSLGGGTADLKTIERRKRQKQEYESVVKLTQGHGGDSRMQDATFTVQDGLNKADQEDQYIMFAGRGGRFVKEKNVAADQETLAFIAMVNGLRSKFKYDDLDTNLGLVVSPKIASLYPDCTSVKLSVQYGTKSSRKGQTVMMTCNGEGVIDLSLTIT